jgi:hypothetical protein
MSRRPLRSLVLVALVVPIALLGCATSKPQQPPPVSAGPIDPADPTAPQTQPSAGPLGGVSATQRAQSALEAMVMGAVLGSTFGPIGMAAGAGTMLIYGAVTGSTPFSTGGGGGGGYGGGGQYPYPSGSESAREAALEQEIESEMERGDSLENEIEAELQRQEELLRQIEKQEEVQESAAAALEPTLSDDDLAERVDPRVAPPVPKERELPAAIFDEERAVIKKGAWDNDKKLDVVKRSLDADRDGKPEQVRYFDQASGALVRKEEDRNYDGRSDAWNVYEGGALVSRKLDTNDDAKIDAWETYANGRMQERVIDRDSDGVRDAFYAYQGESLVSERHDANNDGKMDLVVTYRDRNRVMTEEDSDRDGRMDSWTSYSVVEGKEVVSRIERDTNADGNRDVFETYKATSRGQPELAKREEDKDGDGKADVTSIYENGRLIRREISDPNLVPL